MYPGRTCPAHKVAAGLERRGRASASDDFNRCNGRSRGRSIIIEWSTGAVAKKTTTGTGASCGGAAAAACRAGDSLKRFESE